jgi:hypothetical protein
MNNILSGLLDSGRTQHQSQLLLEIFQVCGNYNLLIEMLQENDLINDLKMIESLSSLTACNYPEIRLKMIERLINSDLLQELFHPTDQVAPSF